jgi:hypothetical protein
MIPLTQKFIIRKEAQEAWREMTKDILIEEGCNKGKLGANGIAFVTKKLNLILVNTFGKHKVILEIDRDCWRAI